MKKFKPFLAMLLSLIFVMSSFPLVVVASPAGVAVEIREESVTTARQDYDIYRLVFAASVPGGFNMFSIVFSYDNSAIVPVHFNNHSDVIGIVHGSTIPPTPFRTIIEDMWDAAFSTTRVWGISGDRTGFSMVAISLDAVGREYDALQDVFAFYFRVVGNDLDNLNPSTFRIEDAREENMQGYLEANFGIVIYSAEDSYIWGAIDPTTISTRQIIADSAVSLVYTNSTAPIEPEFIPVTNIIGFPTSAEVGVPLILSGTAYPVNATNRTITWELVDEGTTGAVISGYTFTASHVGTARIQAIVQNGATVSTNFIHEFGIVVTAPPSGYWAWIGYAWVFYVDYGVRATGLTNVGTVGTQMFGDSEFDGWHIFAANGYHAWNMAVGTALTGSGWAYCPVAHRLAYYNVLSAGMAVGVVSTTGFTGYHSFGTDFFMVAPFSLEYGGFNFDIFGNMYFMLPDGSLLRNDILPNVPSIWTANVYYTLSADANGIVTIISQYSLLANDYETQTVDITQDDEYLEETLAVYNYLP